MKTARGNERIVMYEAGAVAGLSNAELTDAIAMASLAIKQAKAGQQDGLWTSATPSRRRGDVPILSRRSFIKKMKETLAALEAEQARRARQ